MFMECREYKEEEIKAYQEFASLSLDERRRRLIEKFCIDYPDSEFTKAVLTGSYPVPKKRCRKKGNAANRQSVVTTAKKMKNLLKDRSNDSLFD
jgi:hypothetical protein